MKRTSISLVRTTALFLAAAILASQAGCAARTPPPLYASTTTATTTASDSSPSPGPARDPEPQPAAASSSGSGTDHTARDYGWVSIAVGAEAAIVAVVTSAMMLHDKSVRDSECNAQKVCSQDGLSANTSLANLGAWNAAGWTLGAVGLGAGIVLLATHPNKDRETTALTVAPSAGGAALRVQGSF